MEAPNQHLSTLWPTLWSSHKPVEQYLRVLEEECGGGLDIPAPLTPVDTFLIQQIVSYYPAPLTVIDLAADATRGVSTAFWAAHPRVELVVAPRPGRERESNRDWRPALRRALGDTRSDVVTLCPDAETDGPGGWGAVIEQLRPSSLLALSFSTMAAETARAAARLRRLLESRDPALIFLFPLGYIGESGLLAPALEFCSGNPAYRLTALRETSPFFASCQVGLIYKSDDAQVPAALERIGQLYAGNFQFLSLVKDVVESAALQKRMADEARANAVLLEHSKQEEAALLERVDSLERSERELLDKVELLEFSKREAKGLVKKPGAAQRANGVQPSDWSFRPQDKWARAVKRLFPASLKHYIKSKLF